MKVFETQENNEAVPSKDYNQINTFEDSNQNNMETSRKLKIKSNLIGANNQVQFKEFEVPPKDLDNDVSVNKDDMDFNQINTFGGSGEVNDPTSNIIKIYK